MDGNGDGGFERWSGRAFSYAPRWIHREHTSRFLGGAFSDTYFTWDVYRYVYSVLARFVVLD